jgi:hypothetical protein
MGHRTCAGTQWGVCVGETDVVIDPNTTGGGLGSRALGSGGVCGTAAGGPANACDPYCNGFVDTSPGLACAPGTVGNVDGGLSVCPNPTGDGGGGGGAGVPGYGGAPPSLVTTATGDSLCAPSTNAHKANCTVLTQYVDCQQDFRCDPATLTCQWNGANNYFDGALAAPDLTVGAGCDSAPGSHLPVCNRGGALVPAGTNITIDLLNPAQYAAWNTGTCPVLASAPACSKTLVADLAPGACTDITGCALGGDQYAVVNMEAGGVVEAPGACANNAAYVKTSGAPGCAACTLCNTSIEGFAYDPSGYGVAATNNNLPLPGVTVMEPTATPPVMVDGVTCDTCEGLEGKFNVKAVTDYKGSFRIEGVTPGPKTTFTIQAGRWRRRIQVPITACVVNKAPLYPGAVPFQEGAFRLPQNRTDSFDGQANIPKTAIVTGNQESTECLFQKMGVSNAEITSPTAGTPGRIHMFKDKGMSAPTATPLPATLWASQAALDVYTASIYPCSATSETSQGMTLAQSAFYAVHTGKGGHALFNHHAGDAIFINPNRNPTLTATSTWQAAGGPSLFKMLVEIGTPPQQTLYDWLKLYGGMAFYGEPYMYVPDGAKQALIPVAGKTTKWLGGKTGNSWVGGPLPPPVNEDFAGSFSFEMGNVGGVPTVDATCGPSGGHGRVFFNGMHVSPTRGTVSGTFPGSCAAATVALTETEKALEFHLFQLTACQLGGSPPPVVVPLAAAVFTRDFQAVCPVGFRPKWAPFYWESIIPAGTSIGFRAATAELQANLPAAPPAAAPVTALVGSATATTTPATAWDCQGCPAAPVSVDSQLLADTLVPSASWLRIYMTFNPTATLSPALTSWRQVYDCVPAE